MEEVRQLPKSFFTFVVRAKMCSYLETPMPVNCYQCALAASPFNPSSLDMAVEGNQ